MPINGAWSDVEFDGAITFSGGDRVATIEDTGFSGFGYSTDGHGSGKKYVEITVTAEFNSEVGFGVPQASSSAGQVLAFAFGTILVNGSTSLPGPEYTSGDVVGIAIDFSVLKTWIRVNAGNWNDVPGDNPATNTGGVSFSLSEPTVYAYFYGGGSGAEAIYEINTGPSFANTKPSGFDDWYIPNADSEGEIIATATLSGIGQAITRQPGTLVATATLSGVSNAIVQSVGALTVTSPWEGAGFPPPAPTVVPILQRGNVLLTTDYVVDMGRPRAPTSARNSASPRQDRRGRPINWDD